MAIDNVNFISQFDQTNPDGRVEKISMVDDHIREIKKVMKQSFPNINAAVNLTAADINQLKSTFTITSGQINVNGNTLVNVTAVDNATAVQPRSYNDARYIQVSLNLADVPYKEGAFATLFRNTSQPVMDEFAARMQRLWPVGSLFFEAHGYNPRDRLGFGTWVRYGEGRAIGSAGAYYDGYETWGPGYGQSLGTWQTRLTEANIPHHAHGLNTFLNSSTGGGSSGPRKAISIDTGNQNSHELSAYRATDGAGGNVPFHNVSPTIYVGVWIRIA